MAELGVGQQTNEYAQQFNDLSALDDNPVAMQRKAAAKANAQALAEKAEKAGAKPPSFKAAVKDTAPPKPAPDDMKVPLGAGGEADIRKDTNARIAATIREKHPEYEGVPDDKITDGLYNKYYADKMTRDEFNDKVGAKHATEDADKATGVDNALKPITSMPGNVADAASAGMKTFGEGLPDPKSKSFLPSSNPIKMAMGALGVAGAPATGAAKSLVGDPLRENLPDTPAGRAVAGTAEQVASVPLGGVEAAGAKAIGRGVGAVKDIGKDVVGAVTGKPAKTALEGVRQPIVSEVAKGALENRTAADTAGKRAEALQGQQDRAYAASTHDVTRLQEEYVKAGKTVEQATKAAEEHSGLLKKAEEFGAKTEADLLAEPKMDHKEFGDRLYKTVAKMEEDYVTKRAEESGYTKALEAAAEKEVDTSPIRKVMEDWQKITNTSGTDKVIKNVNKRISSIVAGEEEGAGTSLNKQGDVSKDTQTVAKLNSFRKEIVDALRTKVFRNKAVDSETYKVLKAARDSIDGVIDGATPELTAARKKWAELSSPLDIMSEKGPLASVLETNPAGRDAVMAGAQVAREIIKRANEGHPVFKRIIEENPQLRDDAKMAFAQDLFQGNRVPSPYIMQKWLEKNRESLLQLGLFDDFSSLARARKTSQDAIAAATGNVKKTMAQEKAALKQERDAEKSLETSKKRREEVTGNIGKSKDEAKQTAVEKAEDANTYERFEADLRQKPDKGAPAATRDMLKKLHKDGRIDTDTYEDLVRQTHEIDSMKLSSEEMRAKLLKVGGAGLLGAGMSYWGISALKGLLY